MPAMFSLSPQGQWIHTPGVYEIHYELIAPSDGTLVVSLDWDPSLAPLDLFGEGFTFSYFLNWLPPTVGILPVTAGQTYRFSVSNAGWELYDTVPFVLTTSLEPGPVEIPPGCTTAPPVHDWLEWVCVSGGWVPVGHPLAEPAPAVQGPPPTPPQPGDAAGCSSIKPAPDWICLNGGWYPPDHPALAASPNPTPPSPSPAPTHTCSTPDPFAAIPGLSGVCVNGGWVPIGHPLARGGG